MSQNDRFSLLNIPPNVQSLNITLEADMHAELRIYDTSEDPYRCIVGPDCEISTLGWTSYGVKKQYFSNVCFACSGNECGI